MRISIKSNIKHSDEQRKNAVDKASPALDIIWKKNWLNDSLIKADIATVSELREYAAKLAGKYEVALIAAGRREMQAIKAVTDLFEVRDGYTEPVFMPTDFSPKNYKDILEKIGDKTVALLAVAADEEDLQFRCSYSIAKQLAFSQGNKSKMSTDVCAIYSKKSLMLREDAGENEYTKIELPDGTESQYLANTAAVLLPLMIMGVDVEAFLRGFSDCISAPEWDTHLPLMAFQMVETEEKAVYIEHWQKEFEAASNWFSQVDYIENHRSISMPSQFSNEKALHICLAGRETYADIMTPSFEGCDEDGSLQLLLNRERDESFEKMHAESFLVELNSNDAEAIGELIAFLQMSQSIEFLI